MQVLTEVAQPCAVVTGWQAAGGMGDIMQGRVLGQPL